MRTQPTPEPIPCPEPTCPAPATIVDRWTWPSTSGPVEHVKTSCPNGHHLTQTAESLPAPATTTATAMAARDPVAGPPRYGLVDVGTAKLYHELRDDGPP